MQHYTSIYRAKEHDEREPQEILATTARDAAEYILDALLRFVHVCEYESPEDLIYFAAALRCAIDDGCFGSVEEEPGRITGS